MKTILCYGDSNTWGYNPSNQNRYPKELRWTTVLQEELKDNYEVIKEGLNGRTTVWNDPIEGEYKNGKTYLLPCLHTHKPIDLVIVFLGTNDLKYRFSLTAYDIAKGVETLAKMIEKSECGCSEGEAPKILIIVPPSLGKLNDDMCAFKGAEEKSKLFSKEFKKVFEKESCYLLDAGEIIKSSDIDGVHLELKEHEVLGKAVGKKIKEIFNDK